MKVVCYVEELKPDKSLGMTTNKVMISENINKFKILGIEPANDYSAIVFKAGRYIAMVANDADNKTSMTFMDLKDNKQFAKNVATQFEERLRRIFMKNFYELSKEYKKNYDLVSLEVDNSSKSISSN